jgi:hypothetical protein
MVFLSVTKIAPPRFNIGNPAPEGSTGSQWTESFCAKWFCARASNIVDIDRSGSDRPVECCAIEFGWTTLKFAPWSRTTKKSGCSSMDQGVMFSPGIQPHRDQ